MRSHVLLKAIASLFYTSGLALFCIEKDGILCYNKLKVNLLDSGCVCLCLRPDMNKKKKFTLPLPQVQFNHSIKPPVQS